MGFFDTAKQGFMASYGGGKYGALGGLLGGGGQDMSYQEALYGQRMKQIKKFEAQLQGYAGQYRDSFASLFGRSMARHAGDSSAAYGAKGIFTDSGAFASELARKSGDLMAEGDYNSYQFDRENASAVDGARSNAFSAMFGAANSASSANYAQQTARTGGMFQLAGMGLGAMLGGPPGAMAGRKFGQIINENRYEDPTRQVASDRLGINYGRFA